MNRETSLTDGEMASMKCNTHDIRANVRTTPELQLPVGTR